jgi:hypothetical protein
MKMGKLSNQSSKDPVLRRQKGWYGFVHGYSKWIKACEEEGRWDNINWGGGTCKPKSVEKDAMGKQIIKF